MIQERLGHASIRTTLDTHGHLLERFDEGAEDALDIAFEAGLQVFHSDPGPALCGAGLRLSRGGSGPR